MWRRKYYLLWWDIKSYGSQVHFCVRLDAGQHEKEAYEGYFSDIKYLYIKLK